MKRAELVRVARAMLDDKINLIEGVRRICSLRFEVNDPENEAFFIIRAIDSETDHYPLGEIRSRCSSEYLIRIDSEMDDYLEASREYLVDACIQIIKRFS